MACSVIALHELLGKAWTYSLLFTLSSNPKRFNELWRASGRRINQSLLSSRLSELESFGLVERSEDESHVSYAITERGERLKQLLDEIRSFAKERDPTLCESCENCPAFAGN